MENLNIQVKIGTPSDKSQILELLSENSSEVTGFKKENYEFTTDQILNTPEYGFFILAHDGTTPLGLMLFTYEWSDWRNGVMFWM